METFSVISGIMSECVVAISFSLKITEKQKMPCAIQTNIHSAVQPSIKPPPGTGYSCRFNFRNRTETFRPLIAQGSALSFIIIIIYIHYIW